MNKHKIKLPKITNKRSLSRLIAVQILYQYQFFESSEDLEGLKQKLLDEYLLNSDDEISSYKDKVDLDLLDSLVAAAEHLSALDEKISACLDEKYRVEDLDPVILQILHLASFELINFPETPVKVVINEYVDIAGSFFDKRKVTFCNAVIEKIAINLRRL